MKNKFPLENILNSLKNQQTFILLESVTPDKENYLSYVFTDPMSIVCCFETKKIKAAFKKLQQATSKGYYICGFIAYETGYAFSGKFEPAEKYDFPLIWMGVFKKPLIFNHRNNVFSNNAPHYKIPHAAKFNLQIIDYAEKYKISELKLNTSRPEYFNNISKIKRFIENGDTYQVNYTMKYKFSFSGCPFALYQELRNRQPVNYSALIKTPDFDILSFSPELFFRLNKNNITVRPMKGTICRGKNIYEDKKNSTELKNDPKNQAENIMIVDLLRNDLGKISKTGSVKVQRLFSIEQYKTLLQMTSTVKSRLKPGINISKLFSSIFPSGSVTGAPKIHTMELIKKIELEPRKIYTGSIGFLGPKNRGVFNVVIRTILLEKGKGEMGIGSGITYSSDPYSEYKESNLKARFLKTPTFELIETMRWSKKKGFLLLDAHLARLKKSACFFGFPFKENEVRKQLFAYSHSFCEKSNYKVRFLLSINNRIKIEREALSLPNKSILNKIILSKYKTNSNDTFLYHKTTNRLLYNKEYQKYHQLGYYDVIFVNTKNQITEGAISNIFIKKGSLLLTPPESCGLLPGIYRQFLIENNPRKIKERVITINDLKLADEIYLTNSVRGMVKAVLV